MNHLTPPNLCKSASKRSFMVLLLTLLFSQAAYAQSYTISGNLILPDSDQANSDLSVQVSARRTVNGSQLISATPRPTILQGQNSTTFSITVPEVANEEWQLFYSCSSCKSYGPGGTYHVNGTVSTGTGTLLADGTDHTGLVFNLLQADHISGTVSLPNNETAGAGGVNVAVFALDINNPVGASTFVTIAQNQSSADYDLTLQGDASSAYRVTYDCDSGCTGNYLDQGAYSNTGTQASENDATLLAGASDHAAVDMQLIPSGTFSGTLTMPNSSNAPASGTRINVNAFNRDTSELYQQSVVIAANTSSIGYSIDVISDSNAEWMMFYSCSVGCDGLFSGPGKRYSSAGTVASFSAQTLLTGSNSYAGLDFNLLAEKNIQGQVALPNSALASGPIDLTIIASDRNGLSDPITQSVTIANQANAASFDLAVPDLASLSPAWLVSYTCNSNCAGFLSSGYYNSSGTQADFNNGEQLTGNQDRTGINMQLIPPVSLNGTISVPGATISSPIEIQVTAEKTNLSDSNSQLVTIAANATNSASFSVPISASSSDTWRLKYSCVSACSGFINPAYHNTAGSEASPQAASTFAGGSEVNNIDFPLLESEPIGGTLSMPAGVNAPPSNTVVRLSAFDQNSFTTINQETTILAGNQSVAYQFDTVPDSNARWVVTYECLSGCSMILDNGVHTASGTQPNGNPALVLLGSSTPYPVVDIDLIRADDISGEIALFDGQLAPLGGIDFRITVDSGPGTPIFFETVTIAEGLNKAGYLVKPVSDSNVGWQVRYSCTQDCGGHSGIGYYNSVQTTPVSAQATPLAGGQNHSNINLTTLENFTIEGEISLPGGELAGAGGFAVNLQALDAQNSNSTGTSVLIPENQNSVPYTLTINSDASAEWTVRYSCFGQPQCLGRLDSAYYNGANPMQTSQALAQVLAAAQDHTGVDLEIVNGRTISGTFSAPVVAPAGGIRATLSARPIAGNGYSENLGVTIAEGTSSQSYQFDVDVRATEDWAVNYFCTQNCADYVQNGFYNSAGTTTQIGGATPLSPAQDHANINMSLVSAVQFSGTLSLPNANTNGDIEFVVLAEQVQGGQEISQPLQIDAGTTSQSFTLDIPDFANSEWTLRYSCELNCQGYFEDGYYHNTGTTVQVDDAQRLAGDQSSSGLMFDVLQTVEVSGNFLLPANALAEAATDVQLTLNYLDSMFSQSETIQIANGNNSASFSFSAAKLNDTFNIAYNCQNACTDAVSAGFYNSAGGVIAVEDAENLSNQNDHTALQFSAAPLTQISGSLSLPDTDTAGATPIQLRVLLNAENPRRQITRELTLNQGDQTANFSFAVDPDPDTSYQLEIQCLSNSSCLPYIGGYYRTGVAGLFTLYQNQASELPAETSQSALDIQIARAASVSGTLSLPTGVTAPAGGMVFQVATQRPGSETANGNIFSGPVVIQAGQNSTLFDSKIWQDNSIAWLLNYFCVQGCDSLWERGYYVSNGVSTPYRAAAQTISADDAGLNSLDLRLIESQSISGSVSLLQGRVAPGGGTDLEIGGFDVITAEPELSETNTLISIPAGNSQTDYQFDIPRSPAGGWRVSYRCVAGCDDMIVSAHYNENGTVVDANAAQLLNGDRDHRNIDLLLLDSDAEFNNDDDGDGELNGADNCRFIPNPGQQDSNGNGVGDACETNDQLCLPIKISTGGVVLICL